MDNLPHPNCYWVETGKLMAGDYPATGGEEKSRRKLEAILASGVSCFVDLTGGIAYSYQRLLNQIGTEKHVDVGYERYPMPDMGIPDTPEVTNKILDQIDSWIAEGKVPYIHCLGGVGRTGTIVGCWLVRHGLSGSQALAHIADKWKDVAKRDSHPNSPETDVQVRYVMNWASFNRTTEVPDLDFT